MSIDFPTSISERWSDENFIHVKQIFLEVSSYDRILTKNYYVGIFYYSRLFLGIKYEVYSFFMRKKTKNVG